MKTQVPLICDCGNRDSIDYDQPFNPRCSAGCGRRMRREVDRDGRTLRDDFAMAALQSVSCGIIAEANHGTTEASLAATAYRIADAMLAERHLDRKAQQP